VTSKGPRSGGWLGCAGVSLVLAVPFVAISVGMSVEGTPRHYKETRGVVVNDIDIVRFEDIAGNEVEFETFLDAEEGDSFTVYYDPAEPAETAFTPRGRSEEIIVGFAIAAFLGAVAVGTGGVAAWRFYRYRRDAAA